MKSRYCSNRISLIGLAVASAFAGAMEDIRNRKMFAEGEGSMAGGAATETAPSTPNPEKAPRVRKPRAPKAGKVKAAKKPAAKKLKTRAAKKPAAKKLKTRAAKKPKAKKAGTEKMADVLSKAAEQYRRPKGVKTPAGNQVVHCGDETAKKLEGKGLADVYEMAAKKFDISVPTLKKKYGHLNPGQQRMVLGNKLRAAA